MNPKVVVLGVGGVALAGLALGGWLRPIPRAETATLTASPTAANAPATDESLVELAAVLARIEQRLAALERRAPAERKAAVPARPRDDAVTSPADLALLAASVRELKELVGAHLEEDHTSTSPLARLKESKPDPDWGALNELIVAWNRDEQRARRDLLLLGFGDVIERFGSPTESWSGKAGIDWLYHDGLDAVTGKTITEIWLRFNDGMVTDVGVKQP